MAGEDGPVTSGCQEVGKIFSRKGDVVQHVCGSLLCMYLLYENNVNTVPKITIGCCKQEGLWSVSFFGCQVSIGLCLQDNMALNFEDVFISESLMIFAYTLQASYLVKRVAILYLWYRLWVLFIPLGKRLNSGLLYSAPFCSACILTLHTGSRSLR